MGFPSRRPSLILAGNVGASSPADSTTFYLGANAALLSATAALSNIYVPRCVIRGGRIDVVVAGTTGSGETSTLYLRVDNTTDHQLTASITHGSLAQSFAFADLGLPLAEDQAVQFKIVHPAWATNPTVVYYGISLRIQ